MRNVLGCAVVAVLLLACGCATGKDQAPAAATWGTDMDAALADASKHGRPILLDLYTDWCSWCKVLDESTYTDPEFIKFSERFTLLKLNAEVDTVTAARYTVKSYPTVVVLKADGTEIDRVVGYYPAPEFMSQIEDYLAGRNTLASLMAEESTQTSNPDLTAKLADRFYEHGRYPEATERYLRLVALDPGNKSGQVDDALMMLARMSRRAKDYTAARKYAQTVLDLYPESDAMKAAFREVGINWKKAGELDEARKVFLDYVKRFPDDEDAPWAQEQADTLAAQSARKLGA